MLCQGQRAILEFQYDTAGTYMFHAHQSEIAEKGWSGFFAVR
jgi:FtsP/CotA-like multicopper oxidase with cupredoxin domain